MGRKRGFRKGTVQENERMKMNALDKRKEREEIEELKEQERK